MIQEDHHLNKKEILRGRRNLERLFSTGRRWRTSAGEIRIVWVPNGMPVSRFCLGVGRSQGQSHERNYIRRVIREIIRRNRAEIPAGMDYCLMPSGKSFRTMEFSRKKELVLSCLRRAGGRSSRQGKDQSGQDTNAQA